ncbi:MAG: DNA translocase FtsK [Bacteroides sp.]|nr:DNA translocase FtsK [Bacteroides sp.]
MPSSYSPIDESSYTDTAFDPEAMLNGTGAAYPGMRNITPDTTPAPEEIPTGAAYNPAHTSVQSEQQTSAEPAQFNPANMSNPVNPAGAAAAIGGVMPEQSDMNHTKSPSAIRRIWRLICDSRTVMFLGIILVIAAGYSLIVAMSYFANIGNDQSALLNGDFDPEMIKNAGGPFGAWLAHTLIYDWLGVGSFILIYYMAMCGISMLKVYRPPFWSLTLRCLLSAVALSIICGFVTYELASPIYWGGRHGHLLNERLMIFTGFWGALAVSLVMGGLVVILYLTVLKRAINYMMSGINAYRARMAERRAERERIREAEEKERLQREAEAEARRMAEEAARLAEEQRLAAERAVAMAATEAAAEPDVEAISMPAQEKADDEEENGDSLFHTAEIDETDVPTVVSDFDSTDNEDDDDEQQKLAVDPTRDSLPPLFGNNSDEDSTLTDIEPDSLFPNESKTDVRADSRPTADEVLEMAPFDPRAELSQYEFPSIEFLRPAKNSGISVDAQEMEENKVRITETLNHYGIPISRITATVGPTVTLYEIIPAEGVRIAKIKRLEDDIALSLAALGIRIIAPIPGKGTIGIEVPNKDPQVVSMRSIIESDTYANSHMELPMAMGRTISNEVFMADLCKMPHLLVAGATGMGKSVGLNAIIASLLYKKHPAELKFVLIDPKMVEFSLYARLERHYLAKLPDEEDAIITDPSKVVATLNSLCVEMDNRYALLKEAAMRNIKEYNDKFIHRHLNPEKGHRFLPYIVVIVDEFADLIMTAGKEVETPIARIAQKARAVGIHMILATQRPSTNVITGVIKANFPGRIAFRVFQMVDSRTIIDRPGANQLIGRGDMLFSNNGKIDRVQCAFIDTPEVSAICDSINGQVGYPCAYELPEYIGESGDGGKLASVGDRDPLFDECARLVVTTDTASTSSLQRRYSIGYNRAGKIMDQMEAAGIVGPSQGGKPRQVLVDPMTLERILENN